ncbi:Cation/H+ exchanger [Penicillium cf. griseofulvum]|nr:Cation/H+ exchanger [Penicillium cf. griseofulvum]
MASNLDSAFAYHEPSIKTVLNYTGFLLTLNIANTCLDQLLYCGLIGQLFIGVLWGTPGAQWFDQETERVIQQIGYLGLILLIYEGGLSTSIKSLKANILLSTAVAITGICVPMGLSFILKEIVSATSLQSFAAGAALSATSLGTTFTILSTTQLTTTRLGTVTTSAAMLDDVVGLVMIQIISNLGSANSFSAVTVIRPVFVSIGFAVGLLLLCAFCLQPGLKKLLGYKDKFPAFVGTAKFAFLAQTCVLVGIMAGATYAGTSSLFAAYLAGVIVSWFDGLVAEAKIPIPSLQSGDSHDQTFNRQGSAQNSKNGRTEETPSPRAQTRETEIPHKDILTGEFIYSKYYKAPVNRILLPFFFASIGFAIPLTKMFSGQVVWRGIIYAMLMATGKMITGLWLVRFSPSPVSGLVSTIKKLFACAHSCVTPRPISGKSDQNKKAAQRPAIQDDSADVSTPSNVENEPTNRYPSPTSHPSSRISLPPKPKSLYPPSILGLAMVARGEVGYLIASIAESKGIFSDGSSEGPSEIYLVVIWAISLCTLIGPILVGTLVRRVKKLQQSRGDIRSDPLGVWGI